MKSRDTISGEISKERRPASFEEQGFWHKAHRGKLLRDEVLYYARICGESDIAGLDIGTSDRSDFSAAVSGPARQGRPVDLYIDALPAV